MVPNNGIQTERENAIINSILSGVNSCNTLIKAIQEGRGAEFLREQIGPSIAVMEEEKDQLRRDWLAASAEVNRLREELEYIAANALASAPAHIQARASRALGRN